MRGLARRDHVLGSALALVLVAPGCGRIGFDPIGDGPADGGRDGGRSDAASVDGSENDAAGLDASGRDAALDAGGLRWPNMPDDCAVLTEPAFDLLPPGGWVRSGAGIVLDSDPSAPVSPSSVVEWVYPVGFAGGESPGSVSYVFPEPARSTIREVYTGLMWKPSDPWETHATGSNGIFLVQLDDEGSAVIHGLTMQGDGTEPYSLNCDFGGSVLVPNVDDVPVTLGEWHRLELRHRLSTTETSADGLIEWFMDGMLIGRYTDLNFTQALHDSIVLRPIWGGAGGTKTQEDYYWVDHAIVCVNE